MSSIKKPVRKMNKRGIDAMVSYVLLIVIAVAISVLVYGYLKLYLPGKQVECPPDISLIVEQFSCDAAGRSLELKLSNRGLFNVSGAFIRFGEESRTARKQINKGQELFINPPQPLAPGSSTPTNYYAIGDILKPNVSNYIIEIQPAVYQDFQLVPCSNVIIAQPVFCGNLTSSTSVTCNNDSECDDSFFCTNDICVWGICQHNSLDVDDSISCTVDHCDEITDTIIHSPNNVLCNDGISCTIDTCTLAGCFINTSMCNCTQYTLPDSKCDDSNPCTNDICDTDGFCTAHPQNDTATCDDGDVCTINDYCGGGICISGPPPTGLVESCSNFIDDDCDGLSDCNDGDCSDETVCDPWADWSVDHYIIDPGTPPATPAPNTIYLEMVRDIYNPGTDNYHYYITQDGGWFTDWAAGFAMGYNGASDDLYIVGAGQNDRIFWINYSIITIKLDATTLQPELHTISNQVLSQGDATGRDYQCESGLYPPDTPIDVYYGRWAGSLNGSMNFKAESTPYICYGGYDWFVMRKGGVVHDFPEGLFSKIVQFSIADRPTPTGQVGVWSQYLSAPTQIESASVLRKDGSYGSIQDDSDSSSIFNYKSYPYRNNWEDFTWWLDGLNELDGPSAIVNGVQMYLEMTRSEGANINENFDRIIAGGTVLKTMTYSWTVGDFNGQQSLNAYSQSGMVAGNIWAFESRAPSGIAGPIDPAIYFVAIDKSNRPLMLPIQGLTTNPAHPGMWVPNSQGDFGTALETKPIIIKNDNGGFMITVQGDDEFPDFGDGLSNQQVYFYKWKNIEDYSQGLIPSQLSFTIPKMDEVGTGFAHISSQDKIYIVTRNQNSRDDWYGLLDLYVIKKN